MNYVRCLDKLWNFLYCYKYVIRHLYNRNNQINYADFFVIWLLIKMQFSVDELCDLKFTIRALMDDFPILFDAWKPKTSPLKKSHSYFGWCNDFFLAIGANNRNVGFGVNFYESIFHNWAWGSGACQNLRHLFQIIDC